MATRQRAEAETADAELIRRIASVVGHELRNPLAVLNNSSYFLKAKLGAAGLDPKIDKHLGIIAAEIARADRMIADMLTFSRPFEPALSALALGALVKQAVDAAGAGPRVALKIPKGDVEVRADAARLADAVRRLLDNALEAAGPDGAVTVSVERGKREVSIEVRDSGEGVKPEIEAYLGEPFRTGKPRGLGLGLAIARKTMQAHGGRLEGGSRKEGGACFRLVLPVA